MWVQLSSDDQATQAGQAVQAGEGTVSEAEAVGIADRAAKIQAIGEARKRQATYEGDRTVIDWSSGEPVEVAPEAPEPTNVQRIRALDMQIGDLERQLADTPFLEQGGLRSEIKRLKESKDDLEFYKATSELGASARAFVEDITTPATATPGPAIGTQEHARMMEELRLLGG